MISVSEAHKRAQLIILVCVLTADLCDSQVEHIDASCWDALLSLLCCPAPAGFACIGKSD